LFKQYIQNLKLSLFYKKRIFTSFSSEIRILNKKSGQSIVKWTSFRRRNSRLLNICHMSRSNFIKHYLPHQIPISLTYSQSEQFCFPPSSFNSLFYQQFFSRTKFDKNHVYFNYVWKNINKNLRYSLYDEAKKEK
jgi:hypothetical protein